MTFSLHTNYFSLLKKKEKTGNKVFFKSQTTTRPYGLYAFHGVLLLILILTTTGSANAQTIRYVKAGATGSGTSWADASGDFQLMINVSAEGGQVWVAKGTYQPAAKQIFQMKEGVKIYGGFEGNETSLTERNLASNLANGDSSILEGNSDLAISSYGLTTAAVLDGFIIARGGGGLGVGTGVNGGGMGNYDSSPTIANCIFSENIAIGAGGGMYNEFSSPTLVNCTFLRNTVVAINSQDFSEGGGMSNFHSSPTLINCTFSENTEGTYSVGGGMYNEFSSPVLTNCTFSKNSSGIGGGMANVNSSPSLTNCTFRENTTTASGGGVDNFQSSPSITKCIFFENTATNSGGGISNYQSSPIITNCIFSRNAAINGGGGIDNFLSSSPLITSCTFSENTSDLRGGGISNTGLSQPSEQSLPIITNSVFWNNAVPAGADIYQNEGSLTINYSYTQTTQTGTGNIAGRSDPFINSSNPAGADGIFGTEDDGLALIFSSATINGGDPQTNNAGYSVQAGNTDFISNPRILNSRIDMGAYEKQTTVYVNVANAGGTHNGLSWATAYDNFQAAINSATTGDSIFVAKGTYLPAANQSFSMKEGVKIYGGFAGTEGSLSQRNLGSGNNSILKGNGYRVIVSSNLSPSAIIDGFVITGGNAPGDAGGGMYNHNTSPTIANCYFSGNNAQNGGGMFNDNSSPTIINCIFSVNTATRGGGGINNSFLSSPSITNCTFSENIAHSSDGGIYNSNSSPTIANCVFWGNTAPIGADISGIVTISYSYTQTALTGTGNITGSSNPFVNSSDPAGANGIFGTADDGLVLKAGSAAINAGDPQTNSSGYAVQAGNTDITGNPRVIGRIDMGAYENQEALPVTLLSFSATKDGNHTKLKWTTATESNNKEFTIIRSTDGNDFRGIGKVAAAGNSNTPKDYVFYDTNPVNGANYYRLQQTDYDGRTTQSDVRVVNFSFTSTVTVYPNPVKNTVQVVFSANQFSQLELTNINGKVLQRLALNSSDVQKKLDLSNVPPGIYFIKLTGNNVVESRKVMKE